MYVEYDAWSWWRQSTYCTSDHNVHHVWLEATCEVTVDMVSASLRNKIPFSYVISSLRRMGCTVLYCTSFVIESSYSIVVVRCLLSCFEVISKLSNHGHLSQSLITMTLLSGLQYIRCLIDYKSLSSTCAIFYCYMCTIKVLVQHRYSASVMQTLGV